MKEVLKFLHMPPLEAARSVWHPVQRILTASTHTHLSNREGQLVQSLMCAVSLLCSFIPESPPRWNGSPIFFQASAVLHNILQSHVTGGEPWVRGSKVPLAARLPLTQTRILKRKANNTRHRRLYESKLHIIYCY